MTINKICSLVSISWNIQFGTGETIKNMRIPIMVESVKRIQQGLYMQWGFQLSEVLTDGQFEPMRGDLAGMGILLNTVSAGEHVPEVEHYIRTVKERVHCTYNTLPFKRMPTLLVIEMLLSSILWLNSFHHMEECQRR